MQGIKADIFPGSGNRIHFVVSATLAVVVVICVILLFKALFQPIYVLEANKGRTGRSVGGLERDTVLVAGSRPAYDVIAEKNLFSIDRRNYAALTTPASRPIAAQGISSKPPPRFTLVGTVLLEDGKTAVIKYPGRGKEFSYFKVGDEIEGFVVMEIKKTSVLLNGEGTAGLMRLEMHTTSTTSLPYTEGLPVATRRGRRVRSTLPRSENVQGGSKVQVR